MLLPFCSPLGAATITVDATDGDINQNGKCSINEAIKTANDGFLLNVDCVAGSPGPDTIVLTVNVVITDNGDGDTANGSNATKSITSDITIDGDGFKLSSGNVCTPNGTNDAGEFRLLHVAAEGNLSIDNLTLENGCANGVDAEDDGGAIYNLGTLSVANSTLTQNRSYGDGGGIYNASGAALSISNSVLSSNSSSRNGGGLSNKGNVSTISDSTFAGNSADSALPDAGFGGGIHHSGGLIVSIKKSTFSGNSAEHNTSTGSGGALYISEDVTEISNSTFTGNTADSNGAAIRMNGAVAIITTLKNSTFSANDATLDSGIANTDATLQNFINNLFAGGSHAHCIATAWGSINAKNNLSDGNCPGSDLGAVTNFDATLKDNGGPTMTHALLEDSNAIDAGDNIVCPGIDQRGFARSDYKCDIGAYEYGSSGPPEPKACSWFILRTKEGKILDFCL